MGKISSIFSLEVGQKKLKYERKFISTFLKYTAKTKNDRTIINNELINVLDNGILYLNIGEI